MSDTCSFHGFSALLLTNFLSKDRFAFCTLTLGAQENYKSIPFYSTELDSDSVRVNRLFKDASARGITIVHSTVTIDKLRDLLTSGKVLIIVLVDNSRMRESSSDDYRGHYILLCGYRYYNNTSSSSSSNSTGEFIYQDPSRQYNQMCSVSEEKLLGL